MFFVKNLFLAKMESVLPVAKNIYDKLWNVTSRLTLLFNDISLSFSFSFKFVSKQILITSCKLFSTLHYNLGRSGDIHSLP